MRTYNKTKIASVLALTAAAMAFAQSSNENYVQSKTCLNDDCSKRSETITYFDGLGRTKQIVSVKSTPTGKDLVTPVIYDGFGRQVKDILPVPIQTQNSSIHTGITDESAANSYYGVSNAYSEKQLENSPLDRLLQQAAPGEAWKMSSGKTQKFSYDANLGNEVKKFVTTTTTGTVNNVSTGISTLSLSSANSGFYPASTLYKNTVTDEDGNPVTEFKNGQGQTLLIRRNDGSQNVDTYYVYNEYNQLAFVLSPKAVQQIGLNNNGITEEILNELCYQYKYDGRSRLVEKKIPGKDWEFMVYDKQDRLVLTQDGKLRTPDNTFSGRGWLFTKYDEFGRVAYTGFFSNTASRQVMQNALSSMAANAYNIEKRSTTPFTLQGLDVYYNKQAFPTGSMTLLTVNYYDTYPPEAPAVPATVLGQPTMSQSLGSSDDASTKGMATASYVKNIEDNNWTKTYHYYDSMGRQIATKTTNHLGGYTNTETELDFAGIAQRTITYHKRLNTDTERVVTETFTYDSQNRLLVHKHKVDNNPEEILAQNTYNDLSQLQSKKVGGTVSGNGLQTVDYLYNIRGWMTQINDPANLGSDLFGYKINYHQVQGPQVPNPDYPDLRVLPKFNGNIAEVSWKTLTEENEPLKRYGYVYDSLHRLSAGFYQKDSNPSAREYFEMTSYDPNGNISRLKRSGGITPGNPTPVQIDNLRYDYSGNRLTKVTEEQTGNSDGYPYLPAHNTIGYDVNGNMTTHNDKGIFSIQYNYLNLPRQITQNAKVTSYTYRADGTKVKKLFGDIETDYLDGFQYKSTKPSESGSAGGGMTIDDPNEVAEMKLRIIPTAEGYYDALLNQYVYNYTDHLGNVRLSYTDTDKNGTIQPRRYRYQQCDGPWSPFNPPNCIDYWKPGEIVELNDYYPFGLLHNYTATTQNAYQYKYNGKELQETGMYDYGARFYMADIGRWGVEDPLSELQFKYSPYSYVYGNPIRFNDPTGMIGEDPDPKKIYGPKGGQLIEGVVMTYTKPSPLSFMGINNMNAFHASEDRFAAGIRGSKAALATEKFEKNLAFAMGTFGMGGSNLLASAGWVAFDTYMSYQDEDTQGAVANVQLLAMLIQLRHGNLSKVSSVLDALAAEKGIVISNGVTKKGILKADYLFKDVNDAKNFGAKALGSSKTRIYDGSGKWIGWENKAGDQVYWGHGDWGKGVGSSTFPHLNYNINGQKGHLFLENKINNRGQASEFMSYFNLGK